MICAHVECLHSIYSIAKMEQMEQSSHSVTVSVGPDLASLVYVERASGNLRHSQYGNGEEILKPIEKSYHQLRLVGGNWSACLNLRTGSLLVARVRCLDYCVCWECTE